MLMILHICGWLSLKPLQAVFATKKIPLSAVVVFVDSSHWVHNHPTDGIPYHLLAFAVVTLILAGGMGRQGLFAACHRNSSLVGADRLCVQLLHR